MLEMHELTRGEVIVVMPHGRIDTTTAPAFHGTVARLTTQAHRVIVDFTDIQYVSSAGLREFLLLAKGLQGKGGKLALCAMSASVRQVFDVSGFSRIFKIVHDQDGALQALA